MRSAGATRVGPGTRGARPSASVFRKASARKSAAARGRASASAERASPRPDDVLEEILETIRSAREANTNPDFFELLGVQVGTDPTAIRSSYRERMRVAHPDVAVATQRLCTVVTKWTTTHDLALIRIFSYLRHAGKAKLKGELSPDDLNDLVLSAWSDADWAGESEHTQSTGGLWLELVGASSGRCWPISWGVKKQTSTASSSAESETVALSSNIRQRIA